MTEELFLFPESFDTNPSSFLQNAIATISGPFKVNNFKLFAFIDCLDEVDFPFVVAPVRCEGKSVKLYQYKFSDKLPDFKQLGFETYRTENGIVLYLTSKAFSTLASKYKSISIRSGHWPDFSNVYHELAALSHLDVIPSLSKSYLKSLSSDSTVASQSLAEIKNRFHELYDTPDNPSLTLSSLYIEVVRILQIFCFAPLGIYISPDNSSYYFGAVRSSISAFHEKCFSNRLIGPCCLTPATMKQLRALYNFVKVSLRFLGYDSSSDFHSFSSALHKFQADNGIPTDEECNEQTLKLIWKMLLSKKSDPISALSQVDVPLELNMIGENEKFGKIDLNYFDKNNLSLNDANLNNESAKQMTVRLSQVIDSLPSPCSTVVSAQKQLLSTAKFAADHFGGVNQEIAAVQTRIESIENYASEVVKRVTDANKIAESSLEIISNFAKTNDLSLEKVESSKIEMSRENKRTKTLIIVFVILLIVYFVQKYHMRKIAKLVSVFKRPNNSTNI